LLLKFVSTRKDKKKKPVLAKAVDGVDATTSPTICVTQLLRPPFRSSKNPNFATVSLDLAEIAND
jgi:hypothetical protein